MEKKLTDKQIRRIIEKGNTTKIKEFVLDGKKVDGIFKLKANGRALTKELVLEIIGSKE